VRGSGRLGALLVMLHSRMLEALKGLDALVGVPAVRVLAGGRRPLPERPRDVLFIRLWGLGNLALLAPLFAAARPRRLRLLTLARNRAFVAGQFPQLELLPLREPHDPRAPLALLSALARLRHDPPEVVVDCEQFLRLPALLVRRACRAPIVGLDTPGQARAPLLDRAVEHDSLRHASATFGALGRAAGLPPADHAWRLAVPADRRERLGCSFRRAPARSSCCTPAAATTSPAAAGRPRASRSSRRRWPPSAARGSSSPAWPPSVRWRPRSRDRPAPGTPAAA